ncbi:uncharacterized protein LOC125714843 [Brienomyrus brachyistius]|uniref:uncharacterized protein LOC125714843 n=1 Tax=Brienomyrus brachyistius TaxID=42636 RepID=UPI0020B23873|nr:uncharacterized protein LOC125714843 [Brienomyrus brachyistius]XP_048841814.1 uncharacterized protein LOC125714843 [Brienomyrus brachyistius]
MDLHCCVERRGPCWVQETPEGLDSFDAECKEWERELRDMQRNIEELYNEVKARRKETETGPEQKSDPTILNGSLHSTVSTFNHHGSGLTVYQHNHGNHDSLLHCSNGTGHPPYLLNDSDRDKPAGYTNNGNSVLFSDHSNGWDSHVDCSNYDFGSPVICNGNGCSFPRKHNGDDGQEHAMRELEEMLHCCLGQTAERPANPSISSCNLQSIQPDCKYENKKNTSFNSGRDEIGRDNEQVHSYQNERRNISEDTSLKKETLSKMGKAGAEEENNRRNKMSLPGGQWYDMSGFPDKMKATHPYANFWYPDSSETQLPVPQSSPDRKPVGPCSFLGQKCVSPSVLRKFGEMLKENEGKTLLDSGHVTTVMAAKDGAWRSPGKLQMSVQKSNSDTGFQRHSNVISSKCPRGQLQLSGHKGDQMNGKGPTITTTSTKIQSPQRNRTVMGKKVEFTGSFVKGPIFEGGRLEQQRPSHTQRTMEEAMKSWGNSGRSWQPGDCGLYQNGSSVLPLDQIDDIIKLVDMLQLQNQSSCCKNDWRSKVAKDTMEETTVSTTAPFSRPARPMNQRPPSRWAGRGAVTGSTLGSSPPGRKQTSRSFSRQTETVIM